MQFCVEKAHLFLPPKCNNTLVLGQRESLVIALLSVLTVLGFPMSYHLPEQWGPDAAGPAHWPHSFSLTFAHQPPTVMAPSLLQGSSVIQPFTGFLLLLSQDPTMRNVPPALTGPGGRMVATG